MKMTKKNNSISEKITLIVGLVKKTFAQLFDRINSTLYKDFVGFDYRSTQPTFLGVAVKYIAFLIKMGYSLRSP